MADIHETSKIVRTGKQISEMSPYREDVERILE